MKEEIKEILTWLNDKDYYIEDFGYKFKRLSLEENEELLDYITNLQEEIERLNNIIDKALGIANERFNYYSHYKSNNEEHLEDWENIFNA